MNNLNSTKTHIRPKKAIPVDESRIGQIIRSESAQRSHKFILIKLTENLCICDRITGGRYTFNRENCYYDYTPKRKNRKHG